MTLTECVKRECPVCGREIRVLAGRLASHMTSEGPCLGSNILVSWKQYSSFPRGSGVRWRGCRAVDGEGGVMSKVYEDLIQAEPPLRRLASHSDEELARLASEALLLLHDMWLARDSWILQMCPEDKED